MRWIHFEHPDDIYGWESEADHATGGQIEGEWFGVEGEKADAVYFEDTQVRMLLYAMASFNWRKNPDEHEGLYTRKQRKELDECVGGRRFKRVFNRPKAKGFG